MSQTVEDAIDAVRILELPLGVVFSILSCGRYEDPARLQKGILLGAVGSEDQLLSCVGLHEELVDWRRQVLDGGILLNVVKGKHIRRGFRRVVDAIKGLVASTDVRGDLRAWLIDNT